MHKKLIKENTFNIINENTRDKVFRGDPISGAQIIESDNEYRTPSIKTWVYTNIDNRDVWYGETYIPMKATVNRQMLMDSKIYEKAVLVIKSYDFKFKNREDFGAVIHNILLDSIPDINKRAELLTTLESFRFRENMELGDRDRLRVVYKVTEDDLLNNKGVVVDNLTISLDVPELGNDVPIGKSENDLLDANKPVKCKSEYYKHTNCASVELCYSGASNASMTLNLFGEPIVLKPLTIEPEDIITANMDTDSVLVAVNNNGKGYHHTAFSRSEARDMGILIETDEERELGLQNTVKKDSAVLELVKKHLDEKMSLNKFVYEHNVSLHKLFSYIVREEAALLSLEKDKLSIEKEEISTAKEFIKLLGSVV